MSDLGDDGNDGNDDNDGNNSDDGEDTESIAHREGDPFASLVEDVADREGDPFETLEEGVGGDVGGGDVGGGDVGGGDVGGGDVGGGSDPTAAGETESDSPGEDAGADSQEATPGRSDQSGREGGPDIETGTGAPFEDLARDAIPEESVNPFASLEREHERAREGEQVEDPFRGPDEPTGGGADVTMGASTASTGEAEGGTATREGDEREGHQQGTVDDMDAAEQRQGDPFSSAESVFEPMEVGELDEDAVWELLSDAEDRGSVSEIREKGYAEVSKHTYCESCKWFSDPPDIRCSHEGTQIIEFTDMETVRLVDCPIVAERRELEEE